MLVIPLLIAATVIFACVLFHRVSDKYGIPMLLAFIALGMFFGSDGLVKIPFENYLFAEQICSVALIFIMFYGGFGTNWKEAKPAAGRAILLSSLGTILTAGLVGLFCHYVMKVALLESFLIGAVICSTDAASVFSILRSKHLNLKYNTAPLLEVESGSNDPFSYMLTMMMLSLMNQNDSVGSFIYMLFAQIFFGVFFGVGIALLTRFFLKWFQFTSSGFDTIFIVGIAILSYAATSLCGGNGYLSVYITGIILGNSKIHNKQALVHFFDSTTGLMQMLLFFLLGLLSFPSQLSKVALLSLCIALFLTFVARPIAVFATLTLFRGPIQQKLLVSWAGMRGAASIVFAIMAVIHPAVTDNDIFHIVFFIVLFSIMLQGTLLPMMAKKLEMTDTESDVMKTFTDYCDEVPIQFIQFTISESHPWTGKLISEIQLPPDSLLVLLIRDKEKIIPNGNTILIAQDTLILSGKATDKVDVHLYEKEVKKGDEWIDQPIYRIQLEEKLVIMIRRGDDVIIPGGTTMIQENDIVVINNPME